MEVVCLHCGAVFELSEAFVGYTECPKCSELIDIQGRIRAFDEINDDLEEMLDDLEEEIE